RGGAVDAPAANLAGDGDRTARSWSGDGGGRGRRGPFDRDRRGNGCHRRRGAPGDGGSGRAEAELGAAPGGLARAEPGRCHPPGGWWDRRLFGGTGGDGHRCALCPSRGICPSRVVSLAVAHVALEALVAPIAAGSGNIDRDPLSARLLSSRPRL